MQLFGFEFVFMKVTLMSSRSKQHHLIYCRLIKKSFALPVLREFNRSHCGFPLDLCINSFLERSFQNSNSHFFMGDVFFFSRGSKLIDSVATTDQSHGEH